MTVHIPKVVWILAKWISPKQRPSLLRSIVNGIEGGLCMAARAFLNVQPTIWNKTKEHLQVKVTCVWRRGDKSDQNTMWDAPCLPT